MRRRSTRQIGNAFRFPFGQLSDSRTQARARLALSNASKSRAGRIGLHMRCARLNSLVDFFRTLTRAKLCRAALAKTIRRMPNNRICSQFPARKLFYRHDHHNFASQSPEQGGDAATIAVQLGRDGFEYCSPFVSQSRPPIPKLRDHLQRWFHG